MRDVSRRTVLKAAGVGAAVAATDTPGHVLVQLRIGESPLLARITARSRRELDIAPGQQLWAQIKGVALLT